MVKRQPTRPHLYTHKGQTLSNKKANKNKQSHLTDLSPYYHMEGENNRTAPMRSHAQSFFYHMEERTIERSQYAATRSNAQSSFYHMERENNRMAPMRSSAQ